MLVFLIPPTVLMGGGVEDCDGEIAKIRQSNLKPLTRTIHKISAHKSQITLALLASNSK